MSSWISSQILDIQQEIQLDIKYTYSSGILDIKILQKYWLSKS